MRSTNRFLFLLFIAVVITACENKNTADNENPYDTTANKNNEKEVLTAREREFVDDAIEDNNEELAWLNAAVKRGTDAELKTHAQHMLADHEKMNTDLRALANTKRVEVEELDTTVIVLDINEDNPAEWDAEWADEMADKHRRLIRRFERAANFVNDPELKGLVNESLPKLRAHLDMSTKLDDRLGK
jgi:putative membrane protein